MKNASAFVRNFLFFGNKKQSDNESNINVSMVLQTLDDECQR